MPSESIAPLTVMLLTTRSPSLLLLAAATLNPDGIAPPVETLGVLGNFTVGSAAPPKGKLVVATVLEPDEVDDLGIVGMFGKNGMLL